MAVNLTVLPKLAVLVLLGGAGRRHQRSTVSSGQSLSASPQASRSAASQAHCPDLAYNDEFRLFLQRLEAGLTAAISLRN
jgi:hypothetical protein